jgi:hypothetical protein
MFLMIKNVHSFSKERAVEKCNKCSQFQKGIKVGGKDEKNRPIIPLENVVGELRQFVH